MTLKDLGYELVEKEGKYYYDEDLDLQNTNITSLPDNLVVGGSLSLYETKINSLPDNLVVKGYLDIRWTKIASLPDNLIVGRSLWLSGTKITSLPNDLRVGRNLNLSETNITSLPENLVVKGNLYLQETKITSLPGNLIVGEDIYYKNTRITDEEANKVSHNIPKVLFWRNKEYVKVGVGGLFYKVISNKGSIYLIGRVGDYEVHYPYYLITNSNCSKWTIEYNLEEAKRKYNLLNIKEE